MTATTPALNSGERYVLALIGAGIILTEVPACPALKGYGLISTEGNAPSLTAAGNAYLASRKVR